MQCHVGPYEGNDAYVCFVFCDDDAGIAYPMIERLARQGMRIWYAVMSGDDITGSLMKARQRLQHCAAVVLLLSCQAVASHLCRERLTEAVELKKPLVVVHHGQSVISPAMRIQVERGTCLESDLIPSEGVIASILQHASLQQCRGLADARIVVQPYQTGREAMTGDGPDPAPLDPSEATVQEIMKRGKAAGYAPAAPEQLLQAGTTQPAPDEAEPVSMAQPPVAAAQPEPVMPQSPYVPVQQPVAAVQPEPAMPQSPYVPAQPPVAAVQPEPAMPQSPYVPVQPPVAQADGYNVTAPAWQAAAYAGHYNPSYEDDGEKTVRNSAPVWQEENELGERTVVMAPHPLANIAIVSMKTGELLLSGWREDVLVGRKGRNQDGMAEMAVRDECKLFSRTHFRAVSVDGTYSIACVHANGITVNGQDLGKDESIQVDGLADIIVPNRRVLDYYGPSAGEPAMLLVSFGRMSERVRDAATVACLTSVETGETRYFMDEPFELGKSYPWRTDAVSLGTISRRHATIHYGSGQYMLEDHSTNGTELNGEHLKYGDQRPLKAGDRIVIQGNRDMNIREAHFIFRCVTLERTTAP